MLRDAYPEQMRRNPSGRADQFFSEVIDHFRPKTACRLGVITHLLPDRPALLRALGQLGAVEWVIPIPYSEWPAVPEQVEQLGIAVRRPPRQMSWPPPAEWFERLLLKTLQQSDEPLVLCEIGGYFASVLSACTRQIPGRLLGVVEDTEAGHRRYAAAEPLPVAAYSVARSPLKEPEDVLVGESIAFSVERIVRALDRPLRGVVTTVLGYGTVGSATSGALATRGAQVMVWDPNPVRRIAAVAAGFPVPTRETAIQEAELIVGTSGTMSLSPRDVPLLRDGCVLASGSSRQVEFALRAGDGRVVFGGPGRIPMLEELQVEGVEVYLAYAGFPVNFADGASLGAFLQLSQAECVAAICALSEGKTVPGLREVSSEVRAKIADLWIASYLDHDHGQICTLPERASENSG